MATVAVEAAYRASEQAAANSTAKKILDSMCDAFEVARTAGMLHAVFTDGMTAEEKAAVTTAHTVAKKRQEARLRELGIL